MKQDCIIAKKLMKISASFPEILLQKCQNVANIPKMHLDVSKLAESAKVSKIRIFNRKSFLLISVLVQNDLNEDLFRTIIDLSLS